METSRVIWTALGLAILFALPFLIERRRPAMSDERRGSAPGQFAELSQGVTHFQLVGPQNGPLIVCIHGLSTPAFVWGGLTKGLVAMGFRVLAYDLLGRGYSDRPTGLQNKGFFLRQLNDLLEHLEIDKPFYLMGYSMGGAIAAGFAAAHPARVERIVLLAPAGMILNQTAALRFVRERGLLGAWAMLTLFPRQMRKGIRAERDLPAAVPGITDLMERELGYRGYLPALLSSVRGVLAHPVEGEHLTIRRAGLPVLAIWGGEDAVIPASAMGQLAAWNRDVLHEVIEDAGHGLPYTHADDVLTRLGRFLPAPETAPNAAPAR